MALSENDKKNLDSWFSAPTREAEGAWIERLREITPCSSYNGFTRGEGAILFMLNSLLGQVNSIKRIIQTWDEEDEGDTPK